jgi:hypothetical protein
LLTVLEGSVHDWLAPLLRVYGETKHHGNRRAWLSKAVHFMMDRKQRETKGLSIFPGYASEDLLPSRRLYLLLSYTSQIMSSCYESISRLIHWLNQSSHDLIAYQWLDLPAGTKPSTHEVLGEHFIYKPQKHVFKNF